MLKFCDAFPKLFDFVDKRHAGDVRKVSAEETATDTEVEKRYGPTVVMDDKGRTRRVMRKGYRLGPVVERALDNYRAGAVDAGDLATFVLAELADRG